MNFRLGKVARAAESMPIELVGHSPQPSPAVERPVPAPKSPHRPSALLRLYPALGNSAFRTLWLGLLPATLAFQMGAVARPYVAFGLTGAASSLGFVSLANGLPMLLLGLIGGVAADRASRRAVLLWTHTIFFLTAVITVALVLAGQLQLWHLLVISLAQGAAMPFNMPARQAYIADVTGRTLLPNAVALNNAGANFGRLVGPAVAGVLLAVPRIGVALAFLVMAIMYAAALVTVFRLPPIRRRTPGPSAKGGHQQGGTAQLMEGLRYVRSTPSLLAMLGMGAAMGIFGQQYQVLMTVFSERVFHVGASGLGLLMAAAGLGALAGAVTVAATTRLGRPAALQVGLGVVFSAALVGFGLAPSFLVALLLLTMVGFCSAAFMGLNSTLIMSNAPSHLYGRIMSIYLLTFAAQPMGAVPLAWVADVAGGPASMIVASAIVLSIVVGISLFYAPYRRIGWATSSTGTD